PQSQPLVSSEQPADRSSQEQVTTPAVEQAPNQDTTRDTTRVSQLLLLLAGALAAVGVMGLIVQLSTSRRRKESSGPRQAAWTMASPKLAPSIFDMQDTAPASPRFDISAVPPLP